jgi:hypothetical protein
VCPVQETSNGARTPNVYHQATFFSPNRAENHVAEIKGRWEEEEGRRRMMAAGNQWAHHSRATAQQWPTSSRFFAVSMATVALPWQPGIGFFFSFSFFLSLSGAIESIVHPRAVSVKAQALIQHTRVYLNHITVASRCQL